MSFQVDEAFCHSLDGWIVVNLMTADRRMLEKLMGEECAVVFFATQTPQFLAASAN